MDQGRLVGYTLDPVPVGKPAEVHLKILVYLIPWRGPHFAPHIQNVKLAKLGHPNYCNHAGVASHTITDSRINGHSNTNKVSPFLSNSLPIFRPKDAALRIQVDGRLVLHIEPAEHPLAFIGLPLIDPFLL